MLIAAETPADSPADAQSFEFNVFLGNRPIGTHRFDIFRDSPTSQRIESSASFDVRLLGIRAYRYRHRASETWQQGCLREMQASTDDNGDNTQVEVVQSGGMTLVNRPQTLPPRPGCVHSYAYWNPEFLRATSLLNPQTGRFDRVRFDALGRETIEVRGQSRTAERHRLVSDQFTIDIWYSPEGQWLQLDSTRDGRQVRYRLKPEQQS